MNDVLHGLDKNATMQAAIFASPQHSRIETVPLPSPADGEALIQLEACGVCASSIPRWEGRPWFSYPSSPGETGHEGIGRIVKLGDGIKSWSIGDRVAFLSYHSFAEFDLAKANEMVRLPDGCDGFLGEPMGCALNIFRRAIVREGDRVAIVGLGFLGLLLVQLGVRSGARVIGISRNDEARQLAKEFGAESVFDCSHDTIEKVRSLTEGALCDVVIEATGVQYPLDLSGELTKERGRLVIAGFHQDGLRQINVQLWNWRGLDVINAHERDPRIYLEGMEAALGLHQSGELKTDRLFTHHFSLDELDKAFAMTRDRPSGFIKAIVRP